MTPEDYEILCNTGAGRNKPPPFAVKLLEDTCAHSGLDWKMRHVYLMERGGKWGVTLSIDGFRLIGSQDPDYGGQEGPLWVTSADGAWSDIPPDGPIYAAKVGIKHKSGVVTWGVAKFKDYAAGPMWTKFPSTMSAKCAEMLAWRKAFPGRLGGLYGTEEMAQADYKKSSADASGLVQILQIKEPAPRDPLLIDYASRLADAASKAALLEVGKAISADKTLPSEDVVRLHGIYTERRKGFE